MNKIIIDVCEIRKNLLSIVSNKQLVLKANAYGFGNELISHIQDLVSSIVTTDYHEYLHIRKYSKKRFTYILLYESNMGIVNKVDNIFVCLNNLDNLDDIKDCKKYYIRLDPFLGLHGIDNFKEIKRLEDYRGVLMHINEYLDLGEFDMYNKILKHIEDKNIEFSIGGSTALNVIEDRYKASEFLQVRIAREVLIKSTKKDRTNFVLQVQVINQKVIQNESFAIGYKSDRKTVRNGTLILIALGYGDFSIISTLFKKGLCIEVEDVDYKIPVYPCMNTCWLYTERQITLGSHIKLFQSLKEVEHICEELEIDIDEFYSSFNANIMRDYIE